MAYKFDWSNITVNCEKLDQFMEEFKRLCNAYGIGFEVDSDYDSSIAKIIIVPYGKGDFDMFTDSLSEYRGGVPWLDKARDEHGELVDKRNQQRAAELETLREVKEYETYL